MNELIDEVTKIFFRYFQSNNEDWAFFCRNAIDKIKSGCSYKDIGKMIDNEIDSRCFDKLMPLDVILDCENKVCDVLYEYIDKGVIYGS